MMKKIIVLSCLLTTVSFGSDELKKLSGQYNLEINDYESRGNEKLSLFTAQSHESVSCPELKIPEMFPFEISKGNISKSSDRDFLFYKNNTIYSANIFQSSTSLHDIFYKWPNFVHEGVLNIAKNRSIQESLQSAQFIDDFLKRKNERKSSFSPSQLNPSSIRYIPSECIITQEPFILKGTENTLPEENITPQMEDEIPLNSDYLVFEEKKIQLPVEKKIQKKLNTQETHRRPYEIKEVKSVKINSKIKASQKKINEVHKKKSEKKVRRSKKNSRSKNSEKKRKQK